jgi:hypothetical protein
MFDDTFDDDEEGRIGLVGFSFPNLRSHNYIHQFFLTNLFPSPFRNLFSLPTFFGWRNKIILFEVRFSISFLIAESS